LPRDLSDQTVEHDHLSPRPGLVRAHVAGRFARGRSGPSAAD
jgi:hypothetical protein